MKKYLVALLVCAASAAHAGPPDATVYCFNKSRLADWITQARDKGMPEPSVRYLVIEAPGLSSTKFEALQLVTDIFESPLLRYSKPKQNADDTYDACMRTH